MTLFTVVFFLPQDIFDRQKVNELPRLQVQFFESTGIPVFRVRVSGVVVIS